MARLKLSAAGLTSPLDVGARDAAEADDVRVGLEEPAAARIVSLVPPAATPVPEGASDATAEGAPSAVAAGASPDGPPPAPAPEPRLAATPAAPEAPRALAADASDPAPGATPTPAPIDVAAVAATALPDGVAVPDWAADLPADRLQPGALLGRPRQTALILDVAISERLDALAAAAGARATVAALVTAVLHFHLPVDGAAATREIGAYRRARLEDLDRAWEERNARLPGAVRDRLDVLVAEAGRSVADVHRSTLVNALLDRHLPADPREAARLVTRLHMVRGGAFLR